MRLEGKEYVVPRGRRHALPLQRLKPEVSGINFVNLAGDVAARLTKLIPDTSGDG